MSFLEEAKQYINYSNKSFQDTYEVVEKIGYGNCELNLRHVGCCGRSYASWNRRPKSSEKSESVNHR